ncbi:class I SAM-dependent methyltransferase [Schinkia sp. CFF1]
MLNKLKNMIQRAENGSISYSDYMAIALYDDEKGYYMKDRKKIGKEGDFYTNSNVHSVFGKVLARIFARLVQKEMIAPFICEIGAGTGRLANFLLEEWEKVDPATFTRLQYYIVEMSPYHLREQRSVIKHIEKVQQFHSIEEMKNATGEFNGIVLSNELFDAFPVDVVQKSKDELFEVRVTMKDEKLIEAYVPCENVQILKWLEENKITLQNDQRIEIPLAMYNWLEQTMDWFEKGLMLTIDYGYTKEEWMNPVHRDGSLRGYYKHQMIRNPLLHLGDMDLTTHIHLDALIQKSEKVGITLLAMLKQYQFLLRGGILDYLQEHHDSNPFSEASKQNRAIRSLITDDGISGSFTVLIQQKNLDQIKVQDVLLYEF